MSQQSYNAAISDELMTAIIELQSLSSLADFSLAGGTSLALRFNHRRSIDIDLFSSKKVGKEGLARISAELTEKYGNAVIGCHIINEEAGEQYCFLRAFIKKGTDLIIKLEVIQNIALMDATEHVNGVRILTQRDIGLLKLVSASNRQAKKDIYDLDFITEDIPLSDLLQMLNEKENLYQDEAYRGLFDLDDEQSPTENIQLLLAFDNRDYQDLPNRPNHSNDTLDILEGSKSWRQARSSWRTKVIHVMKSLGIDPPAARPVN